MKLPRPQTTVRWKLTLLYGGLFLASGAALLAITYTLVAHTQGTPTPQGFSFVQAAGTKSAKGNVDQAYRAFPNPGSAPKRVKGVVTKRILGGAAAGGPIPANAFGVPVEGNSTVHIKRPGPGEVVRVQNPQQVPAQVRKLLGLPGGGAAVQLVGRGQQQTDLKQLEIWSAIALAIMAVVSGLLGWLVAGRVLRPLRTIATTAQQISEENLHERLALPGPRDELGKLADTIDGLLERLEGAFDAQRRFVANASHELRTPLTSARALLEMALSDPDATLETFRRTCRQALEENEQQEELIDALLALAQGQRGIEQREPVELAGVTADVLRAHELEAAARGLRVDAALTPAVVVGDGRLIARLVSNLVENAIRHNVEGGVLDARVEPQDGHAIVRIANTGSPVRAEDIGRLMQPFQRLAPERIGHRDGVGLGLSIVAAIASVHRATLDIEPGEQGGLSVAVRFPVAADGEGPTALPPASDSEPLALPPAQPPALSSPH